MEVIVTSSLLMLAVTAMLTLFNGIQQTAARQQSRSETSDQVRLAMERMTKEIRQATNIRAGSSPTSLDMDTYVGGVERQVTWAIADGDLTRTIDGNTITMVERVQVNGIFTYTPDATDPSVVTITLVAKPETFQKDIAEITITSEIKLRNR